MVMNDDLFFFKQKTAYEMRIRDWSSDVCSSDLEAEVAAAEQVAEKVFREAAGQMRRARLHVRRITARGVRVTALVKHQRGTFGAIEVEHFADEDQMIATFVLECGTALEARRANAQQRRVTTSAVTVEAGQFVDATL